jgi:hypothetical protein
LRGCIGSRGISIRRNRLNAAPNRTTRRISGCTDADTGTHAGFAGWCSTDSVILRPGISDDAKPKGRTEDDSPDLHYHVSSRIRKAPIEETTWR